MRRRLEVALLVGVLVGGAGVAGAQNSAPPEKIDVMPQAANGIDPVEEFAKGVVALEAKQYVVAAQALDKATKGAPEHYDSWGFLGAARAGLGDWAGSKAAYQQMIRIEPTSAHGHAGLALALAVLKDNADATAELDWLDARLKMCVGKCTDRVLLQTMIPRIRSVMDGSAAPAPMARLEDRRPRWSRSSYAEAAAGRQGRADT
jgi:tetratricopeptide (TPR) repeat protein